MRFNERQMIILSNEPADVENRLSYRKVSINPNNNQNKGFKEFWFKLKYNLLFYFKFDQFGQIDSSQPYGVIILENLTVQREEDAATPFAFSITFEGDQKKHIFSAGSEQIVQKWITALNKAPSEQLKKELKQLRDAIIKIKQQKLEAKTADQNRKQIPLTVGNLIEF
ncbi:hypothetical protein O3M35_003996 [Rhynocoris fuscipes]|uniref:PH domain-containing protein n=1 Tax=Rhynocoris fuscipes TaxID=488301 RepID=A0AAW1CNN3_9HEMI